jgi:hypothetical protein
MCRVLLGLPNLALSTWLAEPGLTNRAYRSGFGVLFTAPNLPADSPVAPVHSFAFKPPYDRPAHTIGA